ncbi:hypothetical protein HY995_01210 [Candidatus Micrarchaeota archaeon]|nr:hypothetical protein [Candidatus Micrarchaeota archaeon]MBI5176687.1 hypothetical protein [Candidatus Micrarchaeota archaeon]
MLLDTKQKPLHEYTITLESSRRGSVAVYDDGIVLKDGRTETPIRSNYVQSVEMAGGAPMLGRVPVKIHFFDMFGNKESATVLMRPSDATALKQDLGK